MPSRAALSAEACHSESRMCHVYVNAATTCHGHSISPGQMVKASHPVQTPCLDVRFTGAVPVETHHGALEAQRKKKKRGDSRIPLLLNPADASHTNGERCAGQTA